LKAQLRESQARDDWRSSLKTADRLRVLLNGAPRPLLEAARADMHLGDIEAAVRELEQFARMGQSADLTAVSEDFSGLVKHESFRRIQRSMAANDIATMRGSIAFVLSDADMLPEDIDYDPHSRRFFITSVREGRIISADVDGSAEFARSPDKWPMVAIKVDAERRLVWATEVAMRGLDLSPRSEWGRSALLCYDLKSGALLKRVEGPRPSAFGDMTLTAQGEVIVSDGDRGGVYKVAPPGVTVQRLDAGDFISPQTPAMHPDGKHVFVPDYLRGVGVLEIATGHVSWIGMEGRFALNGIDGLYFDRGRLIAVQNGTTPERVVVFTLYPSLARIASETIVERATGTLGDPTHGVIVGDEFYYIANSGWDRIDSHGNVNPRTKPSVPRVMRFSLRGALER
jgi:hypothetical protein